MSKRRDHLVFPVRSDGNDGFLVKDSLPEQAVLEFFANQCENVECQVWTAEPQWPGVDVEFAVCYWGENNPEMSPVDEGWHEYMGPSQVLQLQLAVDEAVERIVTPWYTPGELVLEYKPKEADSAQEILDL